MFALSIALYIIWFLAFLNDGTLTVSINDYSEMWIEYVLWVLVTAIITIGFTDYLNTSEND
jgi:succinate dehydrogenase hydrophobic anchor subunit